MTIIKWTDPNNLLTPWFEPWSEMDRWLNTSRVMDKRTFLPAIDVYQDQQAVHVTAELPGFRPEQVKLTLDGSVLTLSGETRKSSEVEEKTYHRKEIRVGSFQRLIELPSGVKADEAKAKFENGILHITIPKSSSETPKSIPISLE